MKTWQLIKPKLHFIIPVLQPPEAWTYATDELYLPLPLFKFDFHYKIMQFMNIIVLNYCPRLSTPPPQHTHPLLLFKVIEVGPLQCKFIVG